MIRLVILVACVVGAQCDDMVKLKSSRLFDRTSSTLIWKSTKAGDATPSDAVLVDKNNPSVFWCRTEFNGIWIPGSVSSDGNCVVAFLKSKAIKKDRFDILLSINGTSRILLEEWDSYSTKPENSILSEDRVLAVVPSPRDESILIAANIGIKETDRKAFTHDDGDVFEVSKAFVLVEDEPTQYNLKDIEYEKKYSNLQNIPVVLNATQLLNEGEDSTVVSGLVSYDIKEIQYWGKPKGTITALKTVVNPPEGNAFDILWGIEAEFKRVAFAFAEKHLPPRSGVNVTLMGTMQKYEAPYSGVLDAYYKDGHSKSLYVNSYHTNQILITVIAKYGTPFFLNGTSTDIEEQSELIYESTTTTTTTTSTTTTTTTTTSTTTSTSTTTPTTTHEEVASGSISEGDPSFLQKSPVLYSGSLEKIDDKSNGNGQETQTVTARIDQSSGGTSEKFMSGLSAIFTALVFWYFGAIA